MTEDVPTADQIRAYLLANGWHRGESGRAAYLMVTLGHTVRMLHEPTEYDLDKAVFDISLAEGRHPADVRDDVLNVATEPADPATNLTERMRHQQLGVYRLFWKTGGSSVASVGATYDGTRWYAPANWTTGSADASLASLVSTDWDCVERVELIEDYRSTSGGDDA